MTTLLRKCWPVFILTLFIGKTTLAQTQYEVLVEGTNEKSLKGILTRQVLEADSTFTWYAESQKIYTPNAEAVEAIKKQADSIYFVVFIGTWCEDSHFVIPRFYSLIDAAGFPSAKVTLIGVDRAKTTWGHLETAFNIKEVPTIIPIKNGKELGRVVEYGKEGLFDKELGEVLSGSGK